MQYRELGRTGLKISAMGFGGIPIQRIDAEGTRVLMHKLMEAGVNYIDTAHPYHRGKSGCPLGQVFFCQQRKLF